MRRLRVVHLIDHCLDRGGAERMVVGIATHLPRDRFDVWVCATRAIDAETAALLSAGDVKHFCLARQSKLDLASFRPLLSLLRRERIDIVHAHMFGSNVWGTLIGRLSRVSVLVAQEHSWSFEGKLQRLVDGQLVGRLATRFVAVSSADAERMVRLEGVPPQKVVVIPGAYIPRRDVPTKQLRNELDLDRSIPVIATIAVLRPEKALSVLLEAHARVNETILDAHLVLVGDGECRAELERRAGGLGLNGRVHFLGFRRDIDSIL
jgi:glycosyltransferase involved in cell wall biosynthesis